MNNIAVLKFNNRQTDFLISLSINIINVQSAYYAWLYTVLTLYSS